MFSLTYSSYRHQGTKCVREHSFLFFGAKRTQMWAANEQEEDKQTISSILSNVYSLYFARQRRVRPKTQPIPVSSLTGSSLSLSMCRLSTSNNPQRHRFHRQLSKSCHSPLLLLVVGSDVVCAEGRKHTKDMIKPEQRERMLSDKICEHLIVFDDDLTFFPCAVLHHLNFSLCEAAAATTS